MLDARRQQLLGMLRCVVEGLAYLHMHEYGPMVHGGLKPSNVLMAGDTAKVRNST